jgi:lysyl-tRNA synthetase class 2
VLTGLRGRAAAAWAALLLVAALWSLVEVVLAPLRIRWVRDAGSALTYLNLPVAASLFSVFVLLIIGGMARRRLRAAWWVLIVFQLVGIAQAGSVAVRTIGDHDVRADVGGASGWVRLAIQGGLSALLLFGLGPTRTAYACRLEPGARRPALIVLVSGLSVSAVVGVGLTLLFPDTLTTSGRRLAWGIRAALGVAPEPSDPGWFGERGYHWVVAVTGLLSAAALVTAALIFFRSARAKAHMSAADELDIRGLLLDHGDRDSLGYFATRRDKSVVFSADRSAALTYRVLANVSLASADPIGPATAWPAVINAWLTEARTYGWFPAVLSCSESGAQAYVAAGLKAVTLGDEAIIDVDGFSLDGPVMEPVRRAVRRVQRAGYVLTVISQAELTPAQLAEVAQRAEDWRGDDTERGFSMALGRVVAPEDGDCVTVLAHDREGALRGVLSFVPWGQRGLSLHLMRRDPTAENGLIEAMVVAVLRAGREEFGVQRISLNFAMFRGIFSATDRVGARPLVRAASNALTFASRFWQIESLYRTNARYQPQWAPRYLCYDSPLTLTRVSLAAGMAEGFLPQLGYSAEPRNDDPVELDGQSRPFAEAAAEQRRRRRERLPERSRLSQQETVRRAKIERLERAGMAAYPASVPRTHEIGELVGKYAGSGPDVRTGQQVSVVGRVRALRDLGGLAFAVLQEGRHAIQIMADRVVLGTTAHQLFKATVDLGDVISVTGEVMVSHRGELSVQPYEWAMAAKCLRPLPDARAGFTDPELRQRQRHLDLIVNYDSIEMMLKRSTMLQAVRQSLVRRGYAEVETPMLQPVHGGANARPFQTHSNAYDMKLYLRIAPELYLKRLCIGGLQKVFELGRNFRNEGVDASHNPEFTALEAYQAFADYTTMRELTRDLIIDVATALYGRPVARRLRADGSVFEVDLSGPWQVSTVHDAVSAACGVAVTTRTPLDQLVEICHEHGLRLPADCSPGRAITELYEALVEKQTQAPTFYLDFPIETSPLTRPHRSDPLLAERWDLVAFGSELGTAYSELNDPIDQRRRLTAQSLRASAGDPEAMQLDEDFLGALEYAMPPTGGLGLGIDRLLMMLTGANIRQTQAFAVQRPTR